MKTTRKLKGALMAAAFLSHAVIYEPASAQTAPMAVDWEHHDRPAFRPGGINYKYVDGVWVVDTDAPPAADARGSGKDWSYSLAKVYEPPTTPGGPLGAHIGYIAVGYVGWSNWSGNVNGCYSAPAPSADFEFPYHLGSAELRW